MQAGSADMLIDASLVPTPYDALREAFATERCVILDGGTAAGETRAPEVVLERHRRYVQAGCDVITTDTRELLRAGDDGSRPLHWMQTARHSVRLARRAIAEERLEGDVAVAFSLDADVDRPDGAETIRLLGRALVGEPPDLVIVEGLSVIGSTLEATVEALLAIGLPVWLSFRRCRHGLCGVYGQHWGGPEGDAFGRAARRFEELGVGALLLGCIPPDHVDGMLSHLRDYTDLPLGVHPNLGYLTSDGWYVDEAAGHAEFARMALRWREEGAQLIGGCCGVGAEQIGAARAALAGKPRGAPRPGEGGSHELNGVRATPLEPWVDPAGRALYPLAFPDLVTHGDVFVPSQASFLVWRHLFGERIGRGGGRCLDVGCGSGLQAIQLALNGAERVDAIDVDPDAADATLANALRNGVVERVRTDAVDLFEWRPEARYDVVVASLFQTPVDPLDPSHAYRPADFWGRSAIDHVIGLLPQALADDGVAYVLQVSLLSQERTAERLERLGLRATVADFGFLPFGDSFRESDEQVAKIERLSDAHHLEICGVAVMVGYLLEITRALTTAHTVARNVPIAAARSA
jgi:S-methylmethionine-dependent homocysteine/selenocysteine methylase/SAM-dependent methyltransferase